MKSNRTISFFLFLPFLLSFVYLTLSSTPNYTHSFSFSLLPTSCKFSSHTSSSYSSIENHSYISFHFIRQPFAIASFPCITFHFIHQSSHTTNTHSYSHSLSIISCPTPFLSIITITYSSHNNLSHCIPTPFFLPSFIIPIEGTSTAFDLPSL